MLAGALLGVLTFVGVRAMAAPHPHAVHYHANWAIWIDGERVDLSAPRFMEDLAACSAAPGGISAETRVHMHDGNHDVVHVHHEGATWGHLLANLGWGAGSDWIMRDDGRLHRSDVGARLSWILNGMEVFPAHNRVIAPGDRLLLSFGGEPTELLTDERFPTVATDAAEYDATMDPAGCMGHGPEATGSRLRRAFWF